MSAPRLAALTAVCLALALLFSFPSGLAQEATAPEWRGPIPDVPAGLSPADTEKLTAQRLAIEAERDAIDRAVESFNAECGEVDEDDAEKVGACRERRRQLIERIERFVKERATFREQRADAIEKPQRTAEEEWHALQAELLESRKYLEQRRGVIAKQIEEIKVPTPTAYRHFHEVVILGMFTDSTKAYELARDETSPFAGKSYKEMNELREGKGGGALVVSFGTPDQNTLLRKLQETARAVGDHLTAGEVSLRTPQGQEVLRALSGVTCDRLVVHSNAASVVEALIQRDIVKVKELNVLGGDRSLLNGHAFQQLLDAGKVDRVVVWAHLNDPVPYLTSMDQLKVVERSRNYAEHWARKILGEAAGGDSRVEARLMWDKGRTGTFEPHYIENYYTGIAKWFRGEAK